AELEGHARDGAREGGLVLLPGDAVPDEGVAVLLAHVEEGESALERPVTLDRITRPEHVAALLTVAGRERSLRRVRVVDRAVLEPDRCLRLDVREIGLAAVVEQDERGLLFVGG